jgi:2-polyprenyl-3-methyl-5-hydroxy-6-metoxy-1,4-benzoquinol methylase
MLDAGCGSGLIAARLSALGHRVTGIDTSTDPLKSSG